MTRVKTNPKNDRLKRDYLIWLKEAKQRSQSTVEQARHAIDRLEAYTGYKDFRSFNKEQAIGYKRHLLASKAERTGKTISLATVHHMLQAIRDFLGWMSGQTGYRRSFKPSDIAYLNLTLGEERQAHTVAPKRYASFEDYRKAILAMPGDTEIERRDKAIMAMLLAIGARDDALIGLKLKHVNLGLRRVFQDPREVRTKFRKSINTYFLPVGDDILNIVREWIGYVHTEKGFGPDDPVFPKTEVAPGADGCFAPQGLSREHWADPEPFRKIFKKAFARVGVPYVHPHTVRDTLTQLAYSLKLSPEEFKAFSQNLGHESPLMTLVNYGRVSDERQAEIMAELASGRPEPIPDDMADRIAEKIAAKLRIG